MKRLGYTRHVAQGGDRGTPRKNAFRNLIYFHEVDKGGHFAASEQPELFARTPCRLPRCRRECGWSEITWLRPSTMIGD